jgi:hypothetical protein
MTLLRLNRPEEAEKSAREALVKDPNMADVYSCFAIRALAVRITVTRSKTSTITCGSTLTGERSGDEAIKPCPFR